MSVASWGRDEKVLLRFKDNGFCNENHPETGSTQRVLPCNDPDRIHVAFDDHRLVPNAGLLLLVTLAHHLGLDELVDCHFDLGDAPSRANAGDKLLTLVASALAGGDCIDYADPLAGPSRRWAAWSRRRPPWGPSCGVSGGAICASWIG